LKTKHIIYGIAIALIAVISVPLVGSAILQSITNTNTGTVSNPQTTINIFYDSINKTDGSTVDWGTLNTGENRLELNVTNISDGLIRICLYIIDLPTDWTLSWSLNRTLLNIDDSVAADLMLTVPLTATNGYNPSWDQTVVAETI